MEYFFTCPYCWQRISMILDTSVESQAYIEDCEVCCQPIAIEYILGSEEEIVGFDARTA